MKNTIFEEFGGVYTQVGDYRLPNLISGAEEHAVGPWGLRHLRWLRKNRRVTYTNLLTTGKLPGYLADIDREAQEMFSLLVEQYATAEGVTEKLKATDQMAWVGRMNSIRDRAAETVNTDLIFT